MSQVFGAEQLGLMSASSLWVCASFLDDIESHEKALGEAGFERGVVPTRADTAGFHPRGDVWGRHLRSDRDHHTWAIARVANPMVDPNARQTDVGGAKPRYSVEIHSVPKNPGAKARALITPIWEGNDITKFLSGHRPAAGETTWPDVKRAVMTGSRRG